MLEPIAYLTCEIKGRDFSSRMLIASHLVRLGYAVVVGQFWNICSNARYAPKGAYHFKTANKVQADNMRHCKKWGHKVVATDEESLCHAESVAAHTTHPDTFEHCDIYLALNESHARAIKKQFPDRAGVVHTVGTPRADLIRSGSYARPHRKPYALVNTSFGWTNSVWQDVEWVARNYFESANLDPNDPVHSAFVRSRIDYEQVALVEMRRLIDWLASSSGLDVIIRPHPSEIPSSWARADVTVVPNTDPYPWLKHATVMVHNDSTLGLEAALMDAPALNISPVDSWAVTQNIRDYNETVKSADEAISAIKSGRTRCKANTASLSPFNAAEATARHIALLLPSPTPIHMPPWGIAERTRIQVEKFTVSADECLSMAREVFPTMPKITQLADSVFLMQPAPTC